MKKDGFIFLDIPNITITQGELDIIVTEILKTNSRCIQLDEFNHLITELDSNTKQINEIMQLQSDLKEDDWKYSNDFMIGMIISKVLNQYNSNLPEYSELRHLLEQNLYVVKNMLSNEVNAFVAEHKGRCVIVIHKSLYNYFEVLSHIAGTVVLKSLCKSFQENFILSKRILEINVAKLKATYNNADDHVKRIDIMLNSLLKQNEMQKYKNYDEYYEDKYVQITNEIFETCLAFVIGHEIGHYYHSHTYSKNIELNHSQELEADKFGMGFTLNYILSCGFPKTYQHLGMLLAQIGMLLFANNIDNNSDTHPTIRTRLKQILENFPKFSLRQSNTEIMEVLSELLYELRQYNLLTNSLEEAINELKILKESSKSNKKLEDFVDVFFNHLQEEQSYKAKSLYNELIMEMQKDEVNINIINGIKSDMLLITLNEYQSEISSIIDVFISELSNDLEHHR